MKRDELPTPVSNHQKASAAVTAALGTLDYPVSKQEAIRKVGGWKIPYSDEKAVPLGSILKGVPADEFEDVTEAANAVDRHWGRIAQTLRKAEREGMQREAGHMAAAKPRAPKAPAAKANAPHDHNPKPKGPQRKK